MKTTCWVDLYSVLPLSVLPHTMLSRWYLKSNATMFTICVRPPNDSILLLEKTEPAQHDSILCHVDSTHFLQTSLTLFLCTTIWTPTSSLKSTISHISTSSLRRSLEYSSSCMNPPLLCEHIIRGAGSKRGHGYTPLGSLSNSQLYQKPPQTD